MGTVYRAHDRMLEEQVAIKVLRAEFQTSAERGRRFRSEIKLARKVTHRNVCRIHEYGEDGALHYISMELVQGVDLKQLLGTRARLPPREAFDIAAQVAAGLTAIHQVGIVHRDLKPSNVMRDQQGVAKLMDFGIAKQWSSGADAGTTGTGNIVGTPDYMSPEQARGESIDPRSDVYALGVMTYELFTGMRPFRAPTPLGTILKHLSEPPPLRGALAARIPPMLVPVLETALAKDPNGRYPGAAEMLEALERARLALAALPEPVLEPAEWEDAGGRELTTFTSASIRVQRGWTGLLKRRWLAAALTALGIGVLAFVVLDTRALKEPQPSPTLPLVADRPLALAPAPPPGSAPSSTVVTMPASAASASSVRKPASPAAKLTPSPPASLMSSAPPEPQITSATEPGAPPAEVGEPSSPPPEATIQPKLEERTAVAAPGNTPPSYPTEARAKGLEGHVTLRVSVSESGSVQAVTVLSGDEPFAAAALDAVKRWRYSPATRDGRPVPSDVIVRIPFRLKRKS